MAYRVDKKGEKYMVVNELSGNVMGVFPDKEKASAEAKTLADTDAEKLRRVSGKLEKPAASGG